MQVCSALQTDNHASTSLLSFLQAGCPSCCPTNSVKALKALPINQLLTNNNVYSALSSCSTTNSKSHYLLSCLHEFWLLVLLQLWSADLHLQRAGRRLAALGRRRIAGRHEMCKQLCLLEEEVEPVGPICLLDNSTNVVRTFSNPFETKCLQCLDTVGWASARASSL